MELSPEKIEENFPGTTIASGGNPANRGKHLCRSAGESAQALSFLQRAASLTRQHRPPEHPDTLRALHNLACGYRHADKLTEAIRLFEQVKQTAENNGRGDDPNALITLANLARAYGQKPASCPMPFACNCGSERLRRRNTGPSTFAPWFRSTT